MENIILTTALNDKTLRGYIEEIAERTSVRYQYCGNSALYVDDSRFCAYIADEAEQIYAKNGGDIWWDYTYRWDAEEEIEDFIFNRAKEIAQQLSDLGVCIEPIPTWAICLLVNGESDSLTDEEIAMVREWQDQRNYGLIDPIDEDEWFDPYPIFGLGSEVRLCYCHKINN